MNSTARNRIENQLILHLVRENVDKTHVDSLLEKEIDWEYLIKIALRHCLIPIIFKNLEEHFQGKIPDEIHSEIHSHCKNIAAFNFVLSAQVISLVNALKEKNLPVLSYKGMTLAQLAYKDVSLRQFSDIDILIRQEDFADVKETLIQTGCKPAWKPTEKQERAILKYYYEYPFSYGENHTLVEVHWKFMEPFFTFDIDTDKIWNRTQTVEILNNEIETLSSEDYLIILCSHGSKHLWERFSWVCDVARLIENTEIDWDVMINRAKDLGSLRMVWFGLWFAKETLDVKIPEEIYQQIIKEPHIEELGNIFWDNMLAEENSEPDWVNMAKLHIKMREKLRHKLIYSKRLLSTKLIDSLFLPMGRPQ